ncbi:hypothetical protein IW261DRAFT_1573800 [Armillaria novae-zelandiae]|uniref:Heterokaryon incompatibility domain-containing protein n=1 Tax=Armillaria novae-zelandiae TaxID=153914 RepID=A0AA39NL33_9AGAR|nr:hypothetical protein IW261DRAFT_1573800 [Armillaria novae-zelandiae]
MTEDHSTSPEYETDGEYTNHPKQVTLTSLTETGQDESTIPVLKQRSYTGEKVIPSALADTLCADLGVEGVLKELNTTLGTSYPLHSVISILDSYFVQNVDFGTAYAYLRSYWYDIPTMVNKLSTREEKDWEMRKNVLADGKITKRNVPPRRVWDLYANRVVPFWVTSLANDNIKTWAISHAWVDEKDHIYVMTSINGGEWPVPMPNNTNLHLIRIEMLNERWLPKHPVEYVWLDVLCLRQEGGKNEHLRLEEWKLDVPTIGSVYERAHAQVVCYFSGLGRPLHLTPDYFDGDRCWFRRAWTLQEISKYGPIIGGETGEDVVDKKIQQKFDEQLASLQKTRWFSTSILFLVSEMQNRVSTKSLDKVAGLVYLLRPDSIPIYDAKQSAADAWEVLIDHIRPRFRVQLLFLYPEPGDGRKLWRPSWRQVMSNRIVVPRFYCEPHQMNSMENSDFDSYLGYCIESGYVRGLGEVLNESTPRQGELVFNDTNGASHTLKIVADHAYLIPDGFYTLLGCHDILSGPDRWVVGQSRQDGRYEKLSIFRSADDEEGYLYSLTLGEQLKTFLYLF